MENEEGEFDLKWFIGVIRRRLWMIIACVTVFCAISVYIALQMQPEYSAEARVFFEGDRINVFDAEERLVNTNLGLEDQVQLVVSQSVLAGVVEDLRLLEHPEFNPEVAAALAADDDRHWLVSYVQAAAVELRDSIEGYRTPGVPAASEAPDQAAPVDRSTQLSNVVRAVRGNLSVRPVSPSVLSIATVSSDAQLSAELANGIAERFIQAQLDAKIEATRTATDWLSARTAELETRVREAETKVQEAQAELSREAGQSARITGAQLDSLNAALSEQQARIPGLEARYGRARAVIENGDGNYASFSDFGASVRLNALRERKTALEAQQRALRNSVGGNHPAMQTIEEQLGEIEGTMREEAQRIAESIGNDLAAARAAAVDLAARMRELESKSLEQSRAELRVRQLEREADAARILYASFLSRLQEAAEQQKLQASDARIISRAEPPSSPTGSKKKLIVAGGGAAGGTLGVCLAFLFEILNTRYRHPQELEQTTGYPVLGTLPAVGKLRGRRNVLDVLPTRKGRLLTEAVRDLRTSILYSNVDRPPKVVMFTSAAPGDGKSTSSLLTALASQEMGRRTVIVECDLRRPCLRKLFKIAGKAPGLVAVLTGEATLTSAIHKDEKTGLNLLTVPARESAGTRHNPADILASQRFRTLIEELRGQYEFVVLDAPPVLAVTDARVIAQMADAMVCVVGWNKTPRAAVEETIKQIERVNAPLIGLCMNAINERKAKRFSSQHYGVYANDYRNRYV